MKLVDMMAPEVNWAVVSKWEDATPRREGVHLVHTFIEEAAPFPDSYTWLALFLWCFVRTNGFTSRQWYDNWDAGHMGGKYLTSREGIRAAAEEFAKFNDTAQLHEEDQMLVLFKELVAFAKGENPDAHEPVTEPPKPPRPTPLPEPEPTPVEPPKPTEPDAPSKPPTDWKKGLKWIGAVSSAILAAWFIIGNFLPPGIGAIVKMILKILEGVFQ